MTSEQPCEIENLDDCELEEVGTEPEEGEKYIVKAGSDIVAIYDRMDQAMECVRILLVGHFGDWTYDSENNKRDYFLMDTTHEITIIKSHVFESKEDSKN